MGAHFLIFEQLLSRFYGNKINGEKGKTNFRENLDNCKMNSTINDLDHEQFNFQDPKKTSTK